jgi:hypothetical protein
LTHKAKIAKELASQHTGTHPNSVDTYVMVTHLKEGRTYNKGFSAMLAEGINIGCIFTFGTGQTNYRISAQQKARSVSNCATTTAAT